MKRIVKTQAALDVDEEDVIPFRFGRALGAGEAIVSAAVVCEAYSGQDADPSSSLVGAAQISGTDVLQKVRGRAPGGVTYLYRATVVTPTRKLVAAVHVPVRRLGRDST